MFNQFRVHYPKGSLLTELSAIDHGKYIVRCLVQVEGTTLVTSLAAAETVELAEDKARSRAIELLGISPTTVTQSVNASLSGELTVKTLAAVVQETPKASSEVSVPLTPNSSVSTGFSDASEVASATHNESVAVTQPMTPNSSVPTGFSDASEVATAKKKKSLVVTQASAFPEAPTTSESVVSSSPESKSEETSNLTPTTPIVTESVKEMTLTDSTATDMPAESEIETSQEVTSPLWMQENISTTQLDETPVQSSSQSEVETDTSNISSSDTTVDFSEIIARTNVELKRLGWTNQQGRDYLVQTYGKRSRYELTDAELLDFLNHLEAEPNPD